MLYDVFIFDGIAYLNVLTLDGEYIDTIDTCDASDQITIDYWQKHYFS